MSTQDHDISCNDMKTKFSHVGKVLYSLENLLTVLNLLCQTQEKDLVSLKKRNIKQCKQIFVVQGHVHTGNFL